MSTDLKKIKICAGASAGGHMNELLQLLEHAQLWPKQPDFYITTLEILASNLKQRNPTYIIGECNRQHPFLALLTLIRCIRVALKERPDVVITTGSLPLAIFCLISKVLGARIIWIDSIASIEQLSMSGRLVIKFADLFLTQWPELAEQNKKAEYAGGLL